MDAMNWIDIAIVLLIVLSAIVGLVRGFVREAFSLATWLAAIVLSIMFYKPLSTALPFQIPNPIAQNVLSFALIFLAVFIVGSVINYLITRATRAVGLGGVDRVLGGAFGVIRGALLVTLLVLLLGLGITGIAETDIWKKSRLVPKFVDVAEWIKQETPDEVLGLISNLASMVGITEGEKKSSNTE
ncbi:MAG TPA: CvpA family protein [Thiotrichaceae bacterium]|nr:CvpA family protein [Thiotrichaceae bacterium]